MSDIKHGADPGVHLEHPPSESCTSPVHICTEHHQRTRDEQGIDTDRPAPGKKTIKAEDVGMAADLTPQKNMARTQDDRYGVG